MPSDSQKTDKKRQPLLGVVREAVEGAEEEVRIPADLEAKWEERRTTVPVFSGPRKRDMAYYEGNDSPVS